MSKIKVAFQTMNAHKDIEENGFFAAAKNIQACGYNALEISGHFEINDKLIEDVLRAKAELGMEICAMSVVYNGQFDLPLHFRMTPLRLVEDFDRVVEIARRIGAKNVRFAGMPAAQLLTLEDVKTYCALTEEYAAKLAKHGIKLCMHNHHGEFRKLDGKFLYDYAMELCPSLCFEYDLLGMLYGTADVYERLAMEKGRAPILHYEETKITNAGGFGPDAVKAALVPCRLGEGCVDVPRFIAVAEESGVEYLIVEATNLDGLDEYGCMKKSADNLKALGYADRF